MNHWCIWKRYENMWCHQSRFHHILVGYLLWKMAPFLGHCRSKNTSNIRWQITESHNFTGRLSRWNTVTWCHRQGTMASTETQTGNIYGLRKKWKYHRKTWIGTYWPFHIQYQCFTYFLPIFFRQSSTLTLGRRLWCHSEWLAMSLLKHQKWVYSRTFKKSWIYSCKGESATSETLILGEMLL